MSSITILINISISICLLWLIVILAFPFEGGVSEISKSKSLSDVEFFFRHFKLIVFQLPVFLLIDYHLYQREAQKPQTTGEHGTRTASYCSTSRLLLHTNNTEDAGEQSSYP